MAKDPGDYAQDEVAKCFNKLSRSNIMVFERIKDAKSSCFMGPGGTMISRGKKELADYMLWYRGTALAIEVKEVKHDSRIATSRLTQLPKLRVFCLTGNLGVVIVYHSPSKLWRWFTVKFAEDNRKLASYDLSGLKTFPNPRLLWDDVEKEIYHK